MTFFPIAGCLTKLNTLQYAIHFVQTSTVRGICVQTIEHHLHFLAFYAQHHDIKATCLDAVALATKTWDQEVV